MTINHFIRTFLVVAATVVSTVAVAEGLNRAPRSEQRLNDGWLFTLGHATQFEYDFMAGTEYFNYLTKSASIHNEGPYAIDFAADGWREVQLPHDWVVDLGYAAEASHSHGYKTVGWRYPESSVGWYRREIYFDDAARERHVELRFDGIFRDADVWFNGFWMGNEPSGYATQTYDISDYIRYGEKNVIAVRVDASLEEGWFYEGAGIYRDVWLVESSPLHLVSDGVAVVSDIRGDRASLNISVEVVNDSRQSSNYTIIHRILDSRGREVAHTRPLKGASLQPREVVVSRAEVEVRDIELWSPETPRLYSLVSELSAGGEVLDVITTRFGLRSIEFSPTEGLLLNGKDYPLRGVNLHQDHAGVGVAIPNALNEYRLQRLKAMGCNAIRTSHNPVSPALLELCDSMGFLLIEENRLTGINDEHIELLERMIRRDRNHPSIFAWSVGNEEWGIEGNDRGERVARTMSDYCHRFDPTRPTTVGVSGGKNIARGVDVVGYNYFVQNDVEAEKERYPERIILGSEETSGCGTRGVYFASDYGEGRMPSFNRTGFNGDVMNVISRSFGFYERHPEFCGLFFWTGLDYRGEPNPLKYPATGSQFGIMDYCGFPKDEFYFLRAMWCDEPQVHMFPDWSLMGHEGEEVEVWVYSNCPEVELFINGVSQGRRTVERGGYAKWDVIYTPGKVEVHGYRNGVLVTEKHKTVVAADSVELVEATLQNDDCRVIDIYLLGGGEFAPRACDKLRVTVAEGVEIVGWGNGDSAFQHPERPIDRFTKSFDIEAFNGCAQVIVRGAGDVSVDIIR